MPQDPIKAPRLQKVECSREVEQLIDQAAERGAKKALADLGIDEDSKVIIKNMIVFMKGVSVGRRALIWLAGFTGALYAIYLAAKKIFGD